MKISKFRVDESLDARIWGVLGPQIFDRWPFHRENSKLGGQNILFISAIGGPEKGLLEGGNYISPTPVAVQRFI